MQQFLALIIPVGNQGPGGSPPYVDIGFPMPQPPFPGGGQPPHPSHPIYNPGGPPGSSPPGYWGGGMGPGVKPQPPAGAHPELPIYIPAPPTSPPGSPPIAVQLPVFPWTPSHPIELPPDVAPPEIPGAGKVEWKTAWTPQTGWVVVGIPTDPHPTPSTAPPA
jgi:hypothetical protein